MFCFCSYFTFIFNDSCQTNYYKIHQTDLCQILRVGRTMARDDQSEIKLLFDPSKHVATATSLLVLFTERIRWAQAASGAAGRANVGLCFASSYMEVAHQSMHKVPIILVKVYYRFN